MVTINVTSLMVTGGLYTWLPFVAIAFAGDELNYVHSADTFRVFVSLGHTVNGHE